ncbi:hypothetical protein EV702DRAFT_1091416 [Suillus placidus]|uniref:Uncharacterized protein n=1 Tax=Suillus placidus TaxID=48579 RepID=A0A9P7D4Z3_9AGAM|nr:hypothetical protein EV702DRAFT_1091416 [Suillus placidus]
MPKSTTAKGTAARPPYKVKSAGTKWGIPPHSSEDSTPAPTTVASMTEEQPAELKISRMKSVENNIPDKVGDELHPKAASEGDASASAAKPMSEGKKTLRKAKTMPARATERGSGQSQLEVCEQGCEITTTCECDSDDGWIHDEGFEEWAAKVAEARAAEAGMSTDDWIANEYGNDAWYPDGLEQGAFDGMSKDDADAKMAQIFRSCGQ